MSATMPDTERMRADMNAWLENEFERNLALRLPGSKRAEAEYWPLWQAACRAQAKRDAEICRDHARYVGRSVGAYMAEQIEKDAGL